MFLKTEVLTVLSRSRDLEMTSTGLSLVLSVPESRMCRLLVSMEGHGVLSSRFVQTPGSNKPGQIFYKVKEKQHV